jgi:ATP-dependent DNA ligase
VKAAELLRFGFALVVDWTDPEGSWPFLSALLAYYDPNGRLVYAGRVGTGINTSAAPFGSPLVLSRVHWVRPELVAEVKFLTWTEGNLLRQVVYEGQREHKPAREVRREVTSAEQVDVSSYRSLRQSGPPSALTMPHPKT